jgi:hypothetical protein
MFAAFSGTPDISGARNKRRDMPLDYKSVFGCLRSLREWGEAAIR